MPQALLLIIRLISAGSVGYMVSDIIPEEAVIDAEGNIVDPNRKFVIIGASVAAAVVGSVLVAVLAKSVGNKR